MSDNLPESIQVALNISSATTTSVVAAVAGRRIKLVSAFFTAAGTTPTVKLQSHTTTAINTGTLAPTAGQPVVLDYHPDGWFTTAPGEALDLVSGGTSPSIQGSLSYVLD